jgi:hypothetical protein
MISSNFITGVAYLPKVFNNPSRGVEKQLTLRRYRSKIAKIK